MFLGSIGAKIKVQGKQNMPKEGACVLVSNHFSYLDPFLIVYSIHRPTSFLMQNDLGIPLEFAWAPYIYGVVLTDRNKLAPSTIKISLNALKNNEVLGVFPEGGIKGTVLASAKPGAIHLSSLKNVPIIPVGISGAEEGWNNLFKGVRSQINVRIGKPFGPFSIKGSKEEKLKKTESISSEMMCRIAALIPDNKHGVFNNDPRIKDYRKENSFNDLL